MFTITLSKELGKGTQEKYECEWDLTVLDPIYQTQREAELSQFVSKGHCEVWIQLILTIPLDQKSKILLFKVHFVIWFKWANDNDNT